jgi:ATP phosphoribosyltransferase regulatory subunit
MRTWLLPEFVEDVLPDEARAIETYRGRLLELFRIHGYVSSCCSLSSRSTTTM